MDGTVINNQTGEITSLRKLDNAEMIVEAMQKYGNPLQMITFPDGTKFPMRKLQDEPNSLDNYFRNRE